MGHGLEILQEVGIQSGRYKINDWFTDSFKLNENGLYTCDRDMVETFGLAIISGLLDSDLSIWWLNLFGNHIITIANIDNNLKKALGKLLCQCVPDNTLITDEQLNSVTSNISISFSLCRYLYFLLTETDLVSSDHFGYAGYDLVQFIRFVINEQDWKDEQIVNYYDSDMYLIMLTALYVSDKRCSVTVLRMVLGSMLMRPTCTLDDVRALIKLLLDEELYMSSTYDVVLNSMTRWLCRQMFEINFVSPDSFELEDEYKKLIGAIGKLYK